MAKAKAASGEKRAARKPAKAATKPGKHPARQAGRTETAASGEKRAARKKAARPETRGVSQKKPARTKSAATRKKSSTRETKRPKTTKPQPKNPPASSLAPQASYKKHRERTAARARFQSAGQREVGPIPPVENPDRRAECEQDLQLALETYFPDVFALGWSSQHIEVIDLLNQTLRFGGMFALAMPRGSGKTSLCIHAGILAMLFGWRKYLVLIGAAAEAAYEMLDIVKVQLETNEMLLADFPEVCWPIWQLEGIAQRAKGQTVGCEKTLIQWSGRRKIVLPTVMNSGERRAARGERIRKSVGGGVIQAVGLLGRLRGMLHQTPAGDSVRPDVFLGDDLQTDQSAKNVAQVERRETVLNGAVRGLAGPTKRIAGLCTVTLIRKGDLADRITDRKLNPHYQGRRFSLVTRWPTHSQLWEKYAELREVDLSLGKTNLPSATQWYADNRTLMDADAVVPWIHRREPHELSALQNAYNLRLENPTTFDAEYQNQPRDSATDVGLVRYPESDDIVARVNGLARLDIPVDATHLFATIDVQQDVLFYVLLAMSQNFSGWIIDYGAYPEQPLGAYWTLPEIQISLRRKTDVPDVQAAWYQGLNQLLALLHAREYTRDDGTQMSIDRVMIDANYGDSSKSVYRVCRQSPYRPLPFHGTGVTARQQPLAHRKKKPGELAGEEWYLASPRGTKTPRHVIADVNLVKTMVSRRWMIPMGSDGGWSLFQNSVAGHRMFADQVSAEYPVETEGRGRTLLEWSLLPGRDNHYGDCLVMAATLALMAGCMPNKDRIVTAGQRIAKVKKSLAQLRAEAQTKRASG